MLITTFLMCWGQGVSHGASFFDAIFGFGTGLGTAIGATVGGVGTTLGVTAGTVLTAVGADDLGVALIDAVTWQPGGPSNMAFTLNRGWFGITDSNRIHLGNPYAASPHITLTYGSSINSIAFDPDGSLLASGSVDNTIQLWEPTTSTLLTTLEGHTESVLDVVFSPDGSLLASGGGDGTVRLWDLTTETLLVTLETHKREVLNVTFSPDGTLLASGSGDGLILLWDLATETPVAKLESHMDDVLDIAFSPDGTLLASASADGLAGLWNLTTETLDATLGHESPVLSVAFSPDGDLLATGSADGVARLWDPHVPEHIGTLGHESPVTSVGFDGNTLVSRSEDGAIRRWGMTTSSLVASSDGSLTEATLNESVVTLTLSGRTFEQSSSKIRNAVTVSGVPGVTVLTDDIDRISDTEVTVELTFDGTNFDTDKQLTFTVEADAIVGYTGAAFSANILVVGIEESVSAAAVSSLREATLNGSVVTLTLAGKTYIQDVLKIREAVSVSGLPGVTIKADSVQRVSDTVITVELTADGTDFDITVPVIFNVGAGVVANYKGDALTAQIYVKESFSAAVASPLREATLDGSVVTLTLTGLVYERDISKIRGAVSVSSLPGVTIKADSIQRVSDTVITVELTADGTDFDTDTVLTFSVDADAIADYTGTGLTAGVPVTEEGRELHLSIYWTNYKWDIDAQRSTNSRIRQANLDGSNVQDLVTQGLGSPAGLALDVVGGKMYWTDWDTEKIQRANLDGSNVEDLVTQGLENPWDIALDVAGGKMYWTDANTEKIQRANLDGSNVQDLITTGLSNPRGLALDVVGGKMYWTDWDTEKIQRANLDGSNVQDLITTGLSDPWDIALDVVGGKMYWTDWGTDKIQRANLDGSDVEDLVTRGLDDPYGIALDVTGGKMYWTDVGTGKIQRANLDGSNVEDLVTTGLSHSVGIALDISSQPLAPIAREDVNRDRVVDVQDIVYVAQRYGQTGQNRADVNGDGVVNVDDIVLVAAVVDSAPAAPSVRSQLPKGLTADQVQQWLTEAKLTARKMPAYERGIRMLEQLLAALTPKQTALLANYPNPFNPETWIPYRLANDADVSLSIYDINGALVRELDLGYQRAGYYTDRSRAAYWDGRNGLGERVASGVYFYQLRADGYSQMRKMVIVK